MLLLAFLNIPICKVDVILQMACDEEATTRENAYLADLVSVNGYVVQGQQLTLTGAQPMTFMEQ